MRKLQYTEVKRQSRERKEAIQIQWCVCMCVWYVCVYVDYVHVHVGASAHVCVSLCKSQRSTPGTSHHFPPSCSETGLLAESGDQFSYTCWPVSSREPLVSMPSSCVLCQGYILPLNFMWVLGP